jgi:hypothetical protein
MAKMVAMRANGPKVSVRSRPFLTVLLLMLGVPSVTHAEAPKVRLLPQAFRIIPSESGDDNYFRRMTSPTGDFIRASYVPPMKTAVLGHEIPEALRPSVTRLSWRWRVQTFPIGANECGKGKSDSAAVVYVSWRRGLRWYALKYVWSTTAPKGAVCEKKRNPFAAQDTVVLESGGPVNEWRTVSLNPKAEFRKHFENGDPKADVPDLMGVGLMSDGDQTSSKSSADFGDFVVSSTP